MPRQDLWTPAKVIKKKNLSGFKKGPFYGSVSTLLSLIVATFNSEWVTAELIVSGLLNVVKYEFIIEISKVLWKTQGLDE